MDLTEFLNDPQLISGISMMQGVPVGQAMTQAQQLAQIRQNMAHAKRALELEESVNELSRRKENLQITEAQQKLKVHDLRLKLLKRILPPEMFNEYSQGLAGSIGKAGGIIPENAPAGLADSVQQAQELPARSNAKVTAGDLAALAMLEGNTLAAYNILNPTGSQPTELFKKYKELMLLDPTGRAAQDFLAKETQRTPSSLQQEVEYIQGLPPGSPADKLARELSNKSQTQINISQATPQQGIEYTKGPGGEVTGAKVIPGSRTFDRTESENISKMVDTVGLMKELIAEWKPEFGGGMISGVGGEERLKLAKRGLGTEMGKQAVEWFAKYRRWIDMVERHDLLGAQVSQYEGTSQGGWSANTVDPNTDPGVALKMLNNQLDFVSDKVNGYLDIRKQEGFITDPYDQRLGRGPDELGWTEADYKASAKEMGISADEVKQMVRKNKVKK